MGGRQRKLAEGPLLFLVAAVQFVNVLDFMMVMPLGPDFALALGIPTSRLGLVGGSYTAAAAVAGLAGSLFLDRFDRRRALGVAMLGLVLGTAAGGFAKGLWGLMAARVVAGLFGGPATSLSFSIVADAVPPERRGRAMGVVMGAFSAASVLGVPAGLELARLGGWRLPFFAVAGLGLAVASCAILLMPPMRGHLAARSSPGEAAGGFFGSFLRDPAALLALSSTATAMAATFAIVPNLAAFLQFNAGWPRERLGLLYMAGGALSFFVLRAVGPLVDRFGAPAVAAFGTTLMAGNLLLGFFPPVPWLPAPAIFLLFMLSNSFRNLSLNALASRVPEPAARARFQSTQSAVQHLASAAGAFLSSELLFVLPDQRLGGMGRVALTSTALALCLPVLMWLAEGRLRRRAAVALPAQDPAAVVDL
jgi:predicted MFS family arabinose efflux permease